MSGKHEQPTTPDANSATHSSPTSRKIRGLWWILAAGVLIVGAGVVVVLNMTVFSARSAVDNYLEAIRDGDGARALQLAGSETVIDQQTAQLDAGYASTALLDGETLASTIEPLTDVHTEIIDEDIPAAAEAEGTQKIVRAHFTDTTGAKLRTDFVVDKAPNQWLVFSEWQLHPFAPTVISITPDSMPSGSEQDQPTGELNGQPQPIFDGDTDTDAPGRALALPPANLEFDYQGSYIAAEDPAVQVLDAPAYEPGELQLEFTTAVTDEFTDTVHEQLSEALRQCTDQPVLQPAGCPFGYTTSNRVDPQTVEWSIQAEPEVEFEITDGSVEVKSISAVAQLNLDEISIVDGALEPVEYEEPFSVYAELELTPEFVSLTPSWG